MSNHQTIAVLDFGSQYTQVIARRIRECSVYSKIYHFKTTAKQLQKDGVIGVILSGGPDSVLKKNAPKIDKKIFNLGVPVLGICYGLQLMAHNLGGRVEESNHREYGHGVLNIKVKGKLFKGLPKTLNVWNSHGDRVAAIPPGFKRVASTENCEFAAVANEETRMYGMQFHPEVAHSEMGLEVIKNFLYGICKCTQDWSMADYVRDSIEKIRNIVGEDRVLLGLSGGVDSSVAAALIHKAIGDQLTCVFVDNGLLRENERQSVVDLYARNFNMDVRVVRAGGKFLQKLKGVSDPERKRKIIGKMFVQVFQESLKKIGDAKFLAQGTLYPDVIESISIDGSPAATIKSHHNVGGLPKNMKFKLLEPLRELFKDEVRALGSELGLPQEVVWRQPFPGPGLGVRVLGEVNARNLSVLRKADLILHEEMVSSEYYYKVWQSFCVFLPVRTVGVMGDERTYDNVIAVRIVESKDAMTADWARIPHEILQRVSTRIINEVKGVNRVVYDISSKPPGTIEWE